jgi:hypothetical protein
MVANMDLDAIGSLCLSLRSDGSYACIDGQHRVEMLRAYGGFETTEVQSEVYKGLTVAEEAAMFRLRNNRIPVSRLGLYHARLAEKDPGALGIQKILSNLGWKVSIGKGDGIVRAIETIEAIYAKDPGALAKVITTITKAWGNNSAGGQRGIIAGLGLIYLRYGDQIDVNNFAERLASMPGGPDTLAGRARGLRDHYRSSLPQAMAELLVGEYNKRRTTTALAPWRS